MSYTLNGLQNGTKLGGITRLGFDATYGEYCETINDAQKIAFPDQHPARFSFAVRHAVTPVRRAVPTYRVGVPDGKSASWFAACMQVHACR